VETSCLQAMKHDLKNHRLAADSQAVSLPSPMRFSMAGPLEGWERKHNRLRRAAVSRRLAKGPESLASRNFHPRLEGPIEQDCSSNYMDLVFVTGECCDV